jgi:uncharacterized protein YjbI with pentapeptide repeats
MSGWSKLVIDVWVGIWGRWGPGPGPTIVVSRPTNRRAGEELEEVSMTDKGRLPMGYRSTPPLRPN